MGAPRRWKIAGTPRDLEEEGGVFLFFSLRCLQPKAARAARVDTGSGPPFRYFFCWGVLGVHY